MGSNRNIRVIGEAHAGSGVVMDIVVEERPLRDAMLQFGVNVFGLSVVISMITAALIYYSLSGLFVRPMRRITANMVRFSMNPEDLSRIIHPSDRKDELGVAESELAKMQSDISQMLHQKSRLASLGLAVSKINHDLRNMLANAQLISDRLGSVQDPTVPRLTPKLIASIDRAIRLCNDTLNFGKAEETVPMRYLLPLRPLLLEVGESLGLPRQGLDFVVEVDPGLQIDADPDQLFRVLNNLIRNSAQVLDSMDPPRQNRISVIAKREGRETTVIVRDTGPGVPPKAKENLFVPFQGSARKGGTGLGLAIVAEIVTAHGGEIMLLDGTEGAAFRFTMPDVGSARLETQAA